MPTVLLFSNPVMPKDPLFLFSFGTPFFFFNVLHSIEGIVYIVLTIIISDIFFLILDVHLLKLRYIQVSCEFIDIICMIIHK